MTTFQELRWDNGNTSYTLIRFDAEGDVLGVGNPEHQECLPETRAGITALVENDWAEDYAQDDGYEDEDSAVFARWTHFENGRVIARHYPGGCTEIFTEIFTETED